MADWDVLEDWDGLLDWDDDGTPPPPYVPGTLDWDSEPDWDVEVDWDVEEELPPIGDPGDYVATPSLTTPRGALVRVPVSSYSPVAYPGHTYGPRRRLDSTRLLELEGISTRAGFYRYDVLDQALNPIGTVDVSRARTPSIKNDTTRTIKRTLTGFEVDPVTAAELDTLGARIRPSLVLEDGSEWPLGVFLFVDASNARKRVGVELSGSLHDQLFTIDQPTAETTAYGRGRNVAAALEQQARRAGLTDFSIDDSSKIVAAPIAWPAGTKRLKIMSELCAMAGFYSPYFDNLGLLRCRAVPAPGAATPTLSYGLGGRIIADTPLESDDLLEAPNRFIAIDDSATDSPIIGIYDLPDSSPISVGARGFAVARVETMQGLESSSAARNAAIAMAAESAAGYNAYSFDAIPDPRHDTFDVVEYLGTVCTETAWELELDPRSVMGHDLREFYA